MPPPVLTMQSTSLRMLVLAGHNDEAGGCGAGTCADRESERPLSGHCSNRVRQSAPHDCSTPKQTAHTRHASPAYDVGCVAKEDRAFDLQGTSRALASSAPRHWHSTFFLASRSTLPSTSFSCSVTASSLSRQWSILFTFAAKVNASMAHITLTSAPPQRQGPGSWPGIRWSSCCA